MNVTLLINDAAHICQVPASTIRRWLCEGKLTRHGTKPCRVDISEVQELTARRLATSRQ